MEILQKETVPGNCDFAQNFHTRKLGDIGALYEVSQVSKLTNFQ